MRVMVMVKATKDSEAGIMPTEELLEATEIHDRIRAKMGG